VFQSVSESQEYCDYCRRYVLTRRIGPNHILHLLLSLLCCWPWVFVWLVLTVISAMEPHRCTRCGSQLGGSILRAILFPLLVVVVFLVALIVGLAIWSSTGSRTETQEPNGERPAPQVPPGRNAEKEDVEQPPEPRLPEPGRPDVGPMPREVRPGKAPKIEPTPSTKKPADVVDGRTLEERKSIYADLAAALTKVEADAVKKFGRKPNKDDNAGFTVPYKLFVERETAKVYETFGRDRGVRKSEAESIHDEGVSKGWPKGPAK